MLILSAHGVTDSSGEGFAVRLFRKGNQRGFVRAIPDNPAAFAAGFNKVCACSRRQLCNIPSVDLHCPRATVMQRMHLCAL